MGHLSLSSSLVVLPFPYVACIKKQRKQIIVYINFFSSGSNYGHPFACGVTLAKLAAVTMDEQGNETFDTSGALDKLRKVRPLSIFMKLVYLSQFFGDKGPFFFFFDTRTYERHLIFDVDAFIQLSTNLTSQNLYSLLIGCYTSFICRFIYAINWRLNFFFQPCHSPANHFLHKMCTSCHCLMISLNLKMEHE